MNTAKIIALTLLAVFAVEIVIVGYYVSKAPKKYTCTAVEP